MATKDESSVDVDFAVCSYQKDCFYFISRGLFSLYNVFMVIQRIVQFEKGSVNILMEKDEKSCEVELSSMSTQSSASPNSKSSNDGVSKESTRTVIPSHSRKRQKVTRSQDTKRLSEIERLKELMLKTDARLSEEGNCTTKTTNLETSQAKIKDFFGPAEKRQKTSESDSDTDSGDENEHADQTVISVMCFLGWEYSVDDEKKNAVYDGGGAAYWISVKI
ncbi:unnamed protein product [Porites lobata]|uniref:Uncharacterized protein n=1 Tax=Porites lobata TaxID=104759 RepID=A0ABN8R446_9CNID|nr:unnamed protein product [Porites lobata]